MHKTQTRHEKYRPGVDASLKNMQIQEGIILGSLRFSIEFSVYMKMSKNGRREHRDAIIIYDTRFERSRTSNMTFGIGDCNQIIHLQKKTCQFTKRVQR